MSFNRKLWIFIFIVIIFPALLVVIDHIELFIIVLFCTAIMVGTVLLIAQIFKWQPKSRGYYVNNRNKDRSKNETKSIFSIIPNVNDTEPRVNNNNDFNEWWEENHSEGNKAGSGNSPQGDQ